MCNCNRTTRTTAGGWEVTYASGVTKKFLTERGARMEAAANPGATYRKL